MDTIALNLSNENMKEIERLSKIQETSNIGKNLYDNDFDSFIKQQIAIEEEKEIKNKNTIEELTYGNYSTLEELNEAIENGEYDIDTPFETENEAIAYLKELNLRFIDENIEHRINSLDSSDYDYYRELYQNYSSRDDFFDDYITLLADIMDYNGFITDTDESRISDSKYLNVYETQEDYDNSNVLCSIRVSDHNTHNYYGDHLNIYTFKPIKEEIKKLINVFANGTYKENLIESSEISIINELLELAGIDTNK